MRLKNNSGFALAFALILIIIIAVASIGLYLSTEFLARETRFQETRYIAAYYAALAGLRHAQLILQDPGAIFSTFVHDGESVIIQAGSHPAPANPAVINNFFTDPALNPNISTVGFDPNNLTITITETGNARSEYAIDATYVYAP